MGTEDSMGDRFVLVMEVVRQADHLYQMQEVQSDAEGAAEVWRDFVKAVEALCKHDKAVKVR